MTGLKGIYSIYDRKAEIYLPPFMEQANGTAIRKLQDMVAQEGSIWANHAEDFDLVKLAEFGEVSGSIKSIQKEVLINLGKLTQGE
jgi:hypothetical protein